MSFLLVFSIFFFYVPSPTDIYTLSYTTLFRSPEEYGGHTMFVDISAKAGTNIDALLEAVVLTADAALELTANPDMDAQGVSIEAHLDRGRRSEERRVGKECRARRGREH